MNEAEKPPFGNSSTLLRVLVVRDTTTYYEYCTEVRGTDYLQRDTKSSSTRKYSIIIIT